MCYIMFLLKVRKCLRQLCFSLKFYGECHMQSKLSIADMLYKGHLVIADISEPVESRSNSHRKTSI